MTQGGSRSVSSSQVWYFFTQLRYRPKLAHIAPSVNPSESDSSSNLSVKVGSGSFARVG
jgi:hypothetical protein